MGNVSRAFETEENDRQDAERGEKLQSEFDCDDDCDYTDEDDDSEEVEGAGATRALSD